MLKSLLLIILFLQSNPLFGQIKVHKHITADDGLISDQVLRIKQDSKGYMWFATFKGISIWDGNNFINLNKESGLTSNAVLDLIETPDSTMLISTFGRGVMTIKDNDFDSIDTKDGLGTNFVLKLRLIDRKPVLITYPIQTIINDEIVTYFENPEILKGAITDFLIDDDGSIYITSKKGFYVKNNRGEKVYTEKDGLLTSVTSFLEKDIYGNILIASSEGLNKYSDGKISTLKYNDKPVNWTISDIHCAEDGTIYYSGDEGLLIEKDGKIELLTTENGLLENPVTTIGEDYAGNIYLGYLRSGISIYVPNRISNYTSREFAANSILKFNGNLYLGTEKGLTILNETGINRISRKNGLISDYIRTISLGESNEIILGTDLGLNILKNGRVSSTIRVGESTQGIYDIEFSYQNDLIIAVRRQGITLFSYKNNSENQFVSSFINTEDTSNKNNSRVHGRNVFENSKSYQTGIIEGSLNYIDQSNGLRSSWIMDMMFTKDSVLAIGYHGSGLSFYKNGEFLHLSKDEGLTDGIIQTIFEDSEGKLWLGTGQGGISIYDNQKIIDTINIKDGLSSNDIRGIVQFNELFYVATDQGINIISEKNGTRFIRKINKNDGLISNNCNNKALYLDDENNLWIGTPAGLSKFNLNSDVHLNNPPKVYLTGLDIFNKPYSLESVQSSHELDYDQNYLKFKYAGINPSAPEKLIYEYRLNGVDKDWVRSNDNSVQYTSLDDGEYNFMVRAQNEWGVWSEPTSLSFVIHPAWWETWWFYSFVFITIASLIAFVVSYRYRQLLAIEKIRTKISTDLHDSIGAGLSEITILSELLNSTPNPKIEDYRKGVGNISVTARSLVGSMSDIVWLVNPKKDSLKDLLLRLPETYFEIFSRSNISFEIKNIEKLDDIRLSMSYRQHLFLLFKEAINNALKYSRCSVMILEVFQKGRDFSLSLADNGRGFDLSNHKSGNGLINMKERAKAIDGKLEIESKPNKGTTIKFSGNI